MRWHDMTYIHVFILLPLYEQILVFPGAIMILHVYIGGKIQVLPQDSECAHRALRLRERGHRRCVEFPKQRCLVRRLGLFLRGGWSESHWGDDDKPWGERDVGTLVEGLSKLSRPKLGIRPRSYEILWQFSWKKWGKLMLHQSHQRVFCWELPPRWSTTLAVRCRKRI